MAEATSGISLGQAHLQADPATGPDLNGRISQKAIPGGLADLMPDQTFFHKRKPRQGRLRSELNFREETMSDYLEAICATCNGKNQLSKEQLEKLEKNEPVECTECGSMVKIKTDPESERKAKLSLLTLTIGAATVGAVALINIFGNAGFPTYYVAIPFILISALAASGQSGSVLELQSVDASD